MRGLAIHHELFDADVSSGTDHSAFQWHELVVAFDIAHLAVINTSGFSWPTTSSNYETTVWQDLDSFLASVPPAESIVMAGIEAGTNHRAFDWPETGWLVIGGSVGLPRADVRIETRGSNLYPREAAAILLDQWSVSL